MEQQCLTLLEILSSDSSDDEITEEIIKRFVSDPLVKLDHFVDTIENFSDEQFKKHFRLSKPTLEQLVEKFKTSQFCPTNNLGGKEAKTAKTHLLAFLWFAGNKCVMREIALLFDMSLSTFDSILTRVLKFLMELAPQIIRFPKTDEELQHVAEEFSQVAGFPNVAGCIDGTYINIRTPKHKIKSTYTNRHDITSLTLQGICDSKKRFLDVFTGTPGKLHDARIFKLSFIHDTINSMNNRYHLLGDSAYPITEHLLTPYRDYGQLRPDQRLYNLKFCATRVKIENSFGLLKGRFRQLIHTDFLSVNRTCQFIIACCVLHNICIENNDLMEELDNDEPHNENIVEIPNRSVSKRRGELKRDNICALLRT